MRKYISILAVALLFVSCDKPSNEHNPTNYTGSTGSESPTSIREDCDYYNYGILNVTNNSTNPYEIYVDGKLATTVSGKTTTTIAVKVGYREFKAVQKSGYLFFPATRESTANVVKCNNYFFSITPII